MKTTEQKNRIEESQCNTAHNVINSKNKSSAKKGTTKKKVIFISIISFMFIGIMLALNADIETTVKPAFSDRDSAPAEHLSIESNLAITKIFHTELTDEPSPVFNDRAIHALALPQSRTNSEIQRESENQTTNPKSAQAINSKIIDNIPTALASAKNSSHKAVKPKPPLQKQISFEAMEKMLNKIHLGDIESAVNKFTSAYKGADLDDIADVLNEKIKTQHRSSKALIMQEYEKLFNITDKRDISFSNINWDRQNNKAIGKGRFAISLLEKGRFKEKMMIGDITLHMTKNYPDVSITEIYYAYDN